MLEAIENASLVTQSAPLLDSAREFASCFVELAPSVGSDKLRAELAVVADAAKPLLDEQILIGPPSILAYELAAFSDAARSALAELSGTSRSLPLSGVVEDSILGYHVSSSKNRRSILRHGLDARRKRLSGIDGEVEVEEGIFFAESLLGIREFVTTVRHPTHTLVDVWSLRLLGLRVDTAWNGYPVLRERVGRSRIALLVLDLPFLSQPARHRFFGESG